MAMETNLGGRRTAARQQILPRRRGRMQRSRGLFRNTLIQGDLQWTFRSGFVGVVVAAAAVCCLFGGRTMWRRLIVSTTTAVPKLLLLLLENDVFGSLSGNALARFFQHGGQKEVARAVVVVVVSDRNFSDF